MVTKVFLKETMPTYRPGEIALYDTNRPCVIVGSMDNGAKYDIVILHKEESGKIVRSIPNDLLDKLGHKYVVLENDF